MSVIGRLDEQVDAILIAPLKKRDGQKADATSQDAKENDMAEPSSQTGKPKTGGNNVSEDEPSASAADRAQLPVWLL